MVSTSKKNPNLRTTLLKNSNVQNSLLLLSVQSAEISSDECPGDKYQQLFRTGALRFKVIQNVYRALVLYFVV